MTAGTTVERWLDHHDAELVAFRRHLHAHPETSGEEHETTRLVAQRLAAAGLVPRVLTSGTGVICDIGSGPGPVVALRADIDALAMQDLKQTEPRSTRDGVAHACGHDVHTAIVLGAGLHLAERLPATGCRVRLLFQPAEERLPGGALDVIADGGLDDVVVVYGLHCEPKLPTGSIGLRVGAITAAADAVTIDLAGPGGHTARPELTVDLVRVLGDVVTRLPDAARRALGGDDVPLKVVFGSVRAGDAFNVIPTHASLRAVVRTTSDTVWDALPDALVRALADVVDDDRVVTAITHTRGVPPVVNDAGAVAVAERAVIRTWGQHAIEPAPQSWGGDDFAWYTQRVPGAYLRLGTHHPDRPAPLDLHAGHFDVDERAIGIGVRLLVGIVEEELRQRNVTRR
ncbi:MAG: amidohydrolase [Acidimicrobiia bacterium]